MGATPGCSPSTCAFDSHHPPQFFNPYDSFLRPYPPEPFLSIGMALVQRSIAKEAKTGRRHWTAKALNRLGYIF